MDTVTGAQTIHDSTWYKKLKEIWALPELLSFLSLEKDFLAGKLKNTDSGARRLGSNVTWKL